MKNPFSKFYWRDHSSDTGIRMCSFAARGLWIEMLGMMAQNEARIGFLEVSGKPVTDPTVLAKLVSGDKDEVARLLAELEQAGVFSKEGERIYSRRMVSDHQRSLAGKEAGAKGGNPTLSQKRLTPRLTPPDNPEVGQGVNLTVGSSIMGSGTGLMGSGTGIQKGECEGKAEQIYLAYPKHVAKPQALKAIAAALRKMPFDQLLAKTKAFAEHVRVTGQDPQFVPYPASWFNGERFNDPLPQPRPANPRPTYQPPREKRISEMTDEEILREALR